MGVLSYFGDCQAQWLNSTFCCSFRKSFALFWQRCRGNCPVLSMSQCVVYTVHSILDKNTPVLGSSGYAGASFLEDQCDSSVIKTQYVCNKFAFSVLSFWSWFTHTYDYRVSHYACLWWVNSDSCLALLAVKSSSWMSQKCIVHAYSSAASFVLILACCYVFVSTTC